jgi:TonB family protein
MSALQRHIKLLWKPPRGKESSQVMVAFRVNRAGELMQLVIQRSSGETLVDEAALAAIRRVFPFKPLPSEFTQPYIDIEFTFDYNVFGNKRRLAQRSGNPNLNMMTGD